MTSVFIVATLATVVYCLWVRRDTWRSHWEAGATFAIVMEGCALLLMTPWAADILGPPLHSLVGLWNVQQLIGWLCLISGVLANIYHMLVRLTEREHVVPIMRKHLLCPVGLGVTVMLVAFVHSPRGFNSDMFADLTGDPWLTLFEVTACVMLLLLGIYTMRLLMAMRHDPRGFTTLVLYMAAVISGFAAGGVAIIFIAVDTYVGPVIWAGFCLSVTIFAYGLARSWQAKKAWFTSAGK